VLGVGIGEVLMVLTFYYYPAINAATETAMRKPRFDKSAPTVFSLKPSFSLFFVYVYNMLYVRYIHVMCYTVCINICI
jgi:hypothetical protein